MPALFPHSFFLHGNTTRLNKSWLPTLSTQRLAKSFFRSIAPATLTAPVTGTFDGRPSQILSAAAHPDVRLRTPPPRRWCRRYHLQPRARARKTRTLPHLHFSGRPLWPGPRFPAIQRNRLRPPPESLHRWQPRKIFHRQSPRSRRPSLWHSPPPLRFPHRSALHY